MTTFELVIGLLLACACLSLLARRLRAPYPAFLALGGAGLALVPGMPAVRLDPELALALFVAPVLLDAAYDSSPRDLRANWLPVSSLVLVAVGLTVAAVASVAKLLVPGMPWAAAIALGAIVAPPDAAAATAVLRQLSPPHRVMVILEGESLLNDATALLIYRVAVAAAAAGSINPWQAGPVLLLTALGGLVLGWVLAHLSKTVIRTIKDIPTSVLMQFLVTFAVWIVADRLGVSAVITVVVYAVTLARNPSQTFDAEHRRASYAVWDVAVFVLNAMAFILVGLQLRPILARADGAAWDYAVFAGAVFATVVAVRLAWVAAHGGLTRLLRPGSSGPAREGAVIGWSGMRGLVTLATALALPDGTAEPAFPYRDLLIAASFAVVLGTLVLQGLTLRPLIAALKLGEDSDVAGEVAHARAVTAAAALAALDGDRSEAASGLRREYEARRLVANGGQHDAPRIGPLLQAAVAAERRVLFEMRARDEIGDDAFHVVEEELDWAEVNARLRSRRAGRP